MASEAAEWLNYHHLLRFRAIAREGGVTRASRLLRVSASTLSEQLAELEAWLGEPLFDRQGRALVLTDAGRAVLDHADAIHESGAELLDLFRRPGAQKKRRALRIGAVAPLSKNLQFDFIEPLLTRTWCCRTHRLPRADHRRCSTRSSVRCPPIWSAG